MATVDHSGARSALHAICAVNAGRLDAVDGESHGTGPLACYRALALARLDRVDEAVAILRQLAPADVALPDAAADVLHLQAVRLANQQDYTAAADLLGEALRLSPDHAATRRTLTAVGDFLPIAHLQSGDRQAASEVWLRGLQQAQTRGHAAHNLALLGYFGAADAVGRDDLDAVEEALQFGLGAWAMVGAADSFWESWAADRRAVYNVADSAMTSLRQRWREFLEEQLGAWATARAERGDPAGAERLRRLQLTAWLERVAALAMAELAKPLCPACQQPTWPKLAEHGARVCQHDGCGASLGMVRPAHELPPCGPVMVAVMGLDDAARRLLAEVDRLPAAQVLSGPLTPFESVVAKTNADLLRRCFSSRRMAFAMVAHRRFNDALNELKFASRKRR